MQKIFLVFVLLTLLFIACDKQHKQENVSDDNSSHVEDILATENMELGTLISVINDERGYFEYIDEYDPSSVMLFWVEGNFINSGNRELFVFYQRKSTLFVEGEKRDRIGLAYCFILDPNNEKVEKVYNVPRYFSMPFLDNTENDIDKDPMEELGRDIVWLNKRIGSIGDFNGNGKEELYLFSSHGLTIDPYFFEYDGSDFTEITDVHYQFARIFSVDSKKKIIHFTRTSRAVGDFSLIWNKETQKYELLGDE